MMEKTKGHVCKLCGRRCASGKVLGGHMRAHMFKKPVKSKRAQLGFQDGNVGYGLRLNPKRSWRFSGEEEVEEEGGGEVEIVCRVCGKGFESKNSLFGHMRHHSVKQRSESLKSLNQRMKGCDNDDEDEEKEVMSLEQRLCGIESLGVVRKKRSARLRYNRVGGSSLSSSSFSGLYLSECRYGYGCGVGDIEEAAYCLMMISKGLGNLGRISSMSESSNNNSVSGEVVSPSQKKMRVRENEDSECLEFKRAKVEMSADCGLDLSECRYGYGCGVGDIEEAAYCLMMISRGLGNLGRISSMSESTNNNSVSGEVVSPSQKKMRVRENEDSECLELKRAKVEMSADCGLDYEVGSTVKELALVSELGGLYCFEELDVKLGEAVEVGLSGFRSVKFGLGEKAVLKACDSVNKVVCDATKSQPFAGFEKKREHVCRICGRAFCTPQALGGHQRVHKRGYRSSRMKNEDAEDKTQIGPCCETEVNCNVAELSTAEMEIDTLTVGGSERKSHICGTCLKVFPSGQALGGHKRSHYVKDSEMATEETRVMKQQIADMCDAFEVSHQLKLQEENDAQQWWTGTVQKKHEMLVDLIPN